MPQLAEQDVIRVWHLFLHELRSPVGIAQGYLRLLTEERLHGEDERRRALQRALEALGRVGALCQDADAFADALENIETQRFPAAALVEALRTQGLREGFEIHAPEPMDAELVCHQSTQRTAESVAAVLGLSSGASGPRSATVTAGESHFVIASGSVADRARLADPASRVPFDAWKPGHGLALVVAARRLITLGSCVWSLPDGAATAVELPLENTHDGSVGHRR